MNNKRFKEQDISYLVGKFEERFPTQDLDEVMADAEYIALDAETQDYLIKELTIAGFTRKEDEEISDDMQDELQDEFEDEIEEINDMDMDNIDDSFNDYDEDNIGDGFNEPSYGELNYMESIKNKFRNKNSKNSRNIKENKNYSIFRIGKTSIPLINAYYKGKNGKFYIPESAMLEKGDTIFVMKKGKKKINEDYNPYFLVYKGKRNLGVIHFNAFAPNEYTLDVIRGDLKIPEKDYSGKIRNILIDLGRIFDVDFDEIEKSDVNDWEKYGLD